MEGLWVSLRRCLGGEALVGRRFRYPEILLETKAQDPQLVLM